MADKIAKKEVLTTDEKILAILTQADTFTPEGGVKPSEYWKYRERVRVKYGLPECGGKFDDPVSYIHQIEQLAKENGIEIRPKHEFELFFQENPGAGGVFFGKGVFRDPTIAVEQHQPDDFWELRTRAGQLSHEIVHAFQDIMFPGMPDHIAEQEAYAYQIFNPDAILFFSDSIEFISSWVNKDIPKLVAFSNSTNSKINQSDKVG